MAGLGFETVASDLSTPAGIDAVIDGVAGKPLALLVNNAGVGSEYELDRPETLGSAANCIRTNLDAPIAHCTRLTPVLRARHRKSGVVGKRVVVRVNLVGRRSIKKKKQRN